MDYKENFISKPIERCDLTLTHAIDVYCKRGWYLHPLNGKIPLLKDWQNKASTDPVLVKQWFEKWPKANLGIVTGICSNLLVLDIDGEEGKHSIAGFHLPETLNVVTARGHHYYYRLPESLRLVSTTKAGLFRGIDTRGRGGFIVAPPSIHESGHQYYFSSLTTALSSTPEWLVQCLNPPKASYNAPAITADKISHYAHAALINEAVAIATTPEGRRNIQLNKAAFSMGTLIATGCINIDYVTEVLGHAALNVGLSKIEIKKTLRSGVSAGMRHPRKVSYE